MKKLPIILLSCIYAFSAYSQISVWKSNVVKTYPEPCTYDSLHINFLSFPAEEAYEYLRYVGQEIYFMPLPKSTKRDYNFNDFITGNETKSHKGPKPFDQTKTGQILTKAIKNSSKSDQKELKKDMEEKEKIYLNPFKIKTNVYKPVFAAYKLVSPTSSKMTNIGSDLAALENKTFSILNVYEGTNTVDTVALSNRKMSNNWKMLWMLTDENGDTLFWRTAANNIIHQKSFIIKGYYDKQIKLYKNQDLVYRHILPHHYVIYGDCREKNNYEEITSSQNVTVNYTFVDINTGQTVSMKDMDVWKCQDISMINDEDAYGLFNILTSETGNTIKIPIGELSKVGFVCKESLEMEENARKLKTEELANLQKEKELRQQEAEKKLMEFLVSRYGQKNASLIAQGKVILGMTKEMCYDSWGGADSTVKNINGEIWVYSNGSSLTFIGNKLVQIIKR